MENTVENSRAGAWAKWSKLWRARERAVKARDWVRAAKLEARIIRAAKEAERCT